MDAMELLNRLVSFNTTSPPGNERPAALYLADVLGSYGFQCEVQELGGNRANLIAEMGEGPGPELMFNGHLDVVPAHGQWRWDPFAVTRDRGRLYGRGTADMKGGIAAMCEAAIRMAGKGGPERGRLKLLFVADEECSNLGTMKYLEAHPAPDYAVIGEPTDLKTAIAHRGVSRDYIDLHAPSRHAALPAKGMDSMKKAGLALLAAETMNLELKAMSHEVLPPPSISVTMIHGYEKDNVVPQTVRLLLDFRILPGMSRSQVEKILKEGLEKAGLGDSTIFPHFYMPGGGLPSGDPFVALCLEERKNMTGEDLRPRAFDASCEQCFFVERGTRAVICGPGSLTQAHTVDEFILEDQLRSAADFYERIITRVIG
ncbi:M20 family metallopeptidase [Lachnospiraceae bacterium 54-53]